MDEQRSISAPIVFIGALILAVAARGNLYAQPTGVLEKLEQDISYIVEKVKPCVVSVSARSYERRGVRSSSKKSFFPFFGRQQPSSPNDSGQVVQVCRVGSGVVYDSLGHIITRTSVVLGATEISVTFVDGRKSRGTYVGCDVQTGVAVIRVDGDSLVPASLSEETLRPGSWVTIIGNSLGVTPSVSMGLVNGIRPDGLVQLSANLNPGLTGSPAFDSQGHLVGMLIASISAGTEREGLVEEAFSGTALLCPIGIVRSAVESILARRMTPPGWVGLTVQRQDGPIRGVRIIGVAPNSPAELAGLQPGDLIVRVGPERTQNIAELLQHLANANPGQVLDFTVLRGRRTLRALVEVVERPSDGDFHVEVESGCGTGLLAPSAVPTSYGSRAPSGRQGYQAELEQRIQRLEKELRKLKSRMK